MDVIHSLYKNLQIQLNTLTTIKDEAFRSLFILAYIFTIKYFAVAMASLVQMVCKPTLYIYMNHNKHFCALIDEQNNKGKNM